MLLELAAATALAMGGQAYNGWPATVMLECEEQSAVQARLVDGRWTYEPSGTRLVGPLYYTIDVANARYQDPEDPRIHYPVDVHYGSLRIQYDPSLLMDFSAPSLLHYVADPQARSGLYVRTVTSAESTYTVVGSCRRVDPE